MEKSEITDEERKERRKQYLREYRLKNKEILREKEKDRKREYRQNNRERIREYHRKYDEEHKEKRRQQKKKHYLKKKLERGSNSMDEPEPMDESKTLDEPEPLIPDRWWKRKINPDMADKWVKSRSGKRWIKIMTIDPTDEIKIQVDNATRKDKRERRAKEPQKTKKEGYEEEIFEPEDVFYYLRFKEGKSVPSIIIEDTEDKAELQKRKKTGNAVKREWLKNKSKTIIPKKSNTQQAIEEVDWRNLPDDFILPETEPLDKPEPEPEPKNEVIPNDDDDDDDDEDEDEDDKEEMEYIENIIQPLHEENKEKLLEASDKLGKLIFQIIRRSVILNKPINTTKEYITFNKLYEELLSNEKPYHFTTKKGKKSKFHTFSSILKNLRWRNKNILIDNDVREYLDEHNLLPEGLTIN